MKKLIEEYEYPLYVTFCITSRCNANCKHCSSKVASKEDISTEKIIETLEDLKNCGVFNLALSGGEPLLHPDFDLIASTAVKLGFSVGVGTNGKIIDDVYAKKLKDMKLSRVQISLDGSTAKTHDKFRGINGMFDEAIEAIRILVKSGINTNVCMTPTKENFKELEQVIDLAYKMGVRGFNLSQFVPMNKEMENLDLSNAEWKEVMELWYRKKVEYKKQMNFTAHEAQLILVDSAYKSMKGFIGCQAGIGNGCILSDGTVLPCVMLNLSLGNVKDKPFHKIWEESENVRALRDRTHLQGKCGNCKNILKCGGCRAVAYNKT